MPRHPEKLLVIGNVSADYIHIRDDEFVCWGGGGLNTAIGATLAGAQTRLISCVGADADGLVAQLADMGVDVGIAVSSLSTCRFTLTYDIEGTLSSCTSAYGAASELTEHAARQIGRGHHHVCARTPLQPEMALAAIAAAGQPFSLDLTGTSLRTLAPRVEPYLGTATHLFLNMSEYQTLRQIGLADRPPRVVVTDAGRTVRILRHGCVTVEMPVDPARVVEPTGAGDVFCGGVLAGHLAGWSDEESVAVGCGLARRSLAAAGALHLLVTHRMAQEA